MLPGSWTGWGPVRLAEFSTRLSSLHPLRCYLFVSLSCLLPYASTVSSLGHLSAPLAYPGRDLHYERIQQSYHGTKNKSLHTSSGAPGAQLSVRDPLFRHHKSDYCECCRQRMQSHD